MFKLHVRIKITCDFWMQIIIAILRLLNGNSTLAKIQFSESGFQGLISHRDCWGIK